MLYVRMRSEHDTSACTSRIPWVLAFANERTPQTRRMYVYCVDPLLALRVLRIHKDAGCMSYTSMADTFEYDVDLRTCFKERPSPRPRKHDGYHARMPHKRVHTTQYYIPRSRTRGYPALVCYTISREF